MTNKKVLAAVEGKHHDRKPRYSRAKATDDLEKWLAEQGAVESRTFDEDTGRQMRTFTIDLRK